LFYQKQTYPLIKKESPDLPSKDIRKAVAERWKSLSDEEKKPYRTLQEEDKIRFANETKAIEKKKSELHASCSESI